MKMTTLPEEFQNEHIQYALEVEQALSSLESNLHNSDDPEEIITKMLVAAVTFYDGDWAGIMEADLTMKVWSTLWWYNRKTDGMTPNSFGDLQEGEYLVRWIDALMHGTPMVIHDIEDIAKSSPLEYAFMKQNSVSSIIAVPFWKRPTGFLIVRNPKRYLNRSSLLQMMAFVAVSSVNEKRLMDSTKLKMIPDVIQKDSDIIINVFDELQIITSKGVLTEKDLKSPKINKLIVYLLQHTRRPASPYEIVRDLWPEDDLSKAGMNVKSLVYRCQQMFSLISDYRLIESTGSGYWLSPDLNIITDLGIFEDLWNKAQVTADLQAKGHLLKKAMEEMADRLLVSENYLGKVERGIRRPSFEFVMQFAATVDVTVDFLLMNRNIKRPLNETALSLAEQLQTFVDQNSRKEDNLSLNGTTSP